MMRRFYVVPLLALAVPLLAQGDNPAVNYRRGTPLLTKPMQMNSRIAFRCAPLTPAEQVKLNQQEQSIHGNKYVQVYVSAIGKATAELQQRNRSEYEKALQKTSYTTEAKAQNLDRLFWAIPYRFPVGTVLTKEKFDNPQGKGAPELLTVMVKREKGYNPACFDWEFLVVEGTGKKVLERGKLERCQGCHLKETRTDGVAILNPFERYLVARGSR